MTQSIILCGAGGHAKVIIDIIHASKRYSILGLIDNDKPVNALFYGYEILGRDENIASLLSEQKNCSVFVAIGDNKTREKIVSQISYDFKAVKFATLVHPSAVISPSACIAEGSVVMPGVCINADVRIGRHCIVNTRASIDHECELEDFVSLSPGVTLAGNVCVKQGAFLGVGTNVVPQVEVPADSFIKAGSLVTVKSNQPKPVA